MLQLISFNYWHRRFNYIGKTFTGHTNVVKTIGCLLIPLGGHFYTEGMDTPGGFNCDPPKGDVYFYPGGHLLDF